MESESNIKVASHFNSLVCCVQLCFISRRLSIFSVLNLSFSLQVGSYKDITEESVSLFHMLEPRIGNRYFQKMMMMMIVKNAVYSIASMPPFMLNCVWEL